MVLENDHMLYRCDPDGNPRHLSVAIDKYNYKLEYYSLFGGVTQFPGDKFEHINGYPIQYWGWGAEDDDMWMRTFAYGAYKLSRTDPEVAHWKMLKHGHDSGNKPNPQRVELLREWDKMRPSYGLKQVNYSIVRREMYNSFEKITVDINAPADNEKQYFDYFE